MKPSLQARDALPRMAALIASATILLFGLAFRCDCLLLAILVLWASSMCFLCAKLDRHGFFALFLCAFFVFLVGAQTMKEFFGIRMYWDYDGPTYAHLNFSVLLSLACLLVGYGTVYFQKMRWSLPATAIQAPPRAEKNEWVKYISKISFFVLCIPWFLLLAEQSLTAQKGSYVDYYSFTSRFPAFVTTLAFMCPFSFCTFLGTFPSKREARLPMALVVVYAFASLLIGRRMYFVSYILLLLGYALYRNSDKSEKEVWLSKKQIAALLCLIPLLLVFLYSYRYIRYGKQVAASGFWEALLGFFAQQGYSANLIPLGKLFETQLPDDLYSFFDTVRLWRLSPIPQILTGQDFLPYYTGSRAHLAIYSGSYARIISLLCMPQAYMAGYGTGSCYVAELYHDFGYPGICIGNCFLGALFAWFVAPARERWLRNAIGLAMFPRFLMLPRYNFDNVCYFLLSPSFWLYIGLISVLVDEMLALGTTRQSTSPPSRNLPLP